MAVSFQVKDGAQKAIHEWNTRLADMEPAMKVIGQAVHAAVILNFEAGGRPSWKPLSRVTIQQREKQKKWPGKPLQRTGSLKQDIHEKPGKSNVVLWAGRKYAAIQHYGAKKGAFGTITARVRSHERVTRTGRKTQVRAHTRRMAVPWGDIPARPFMTITHADQQEIVHVLADFIVKGVMK